MTALQDGKELRYSTDYHESVITRYYLNREDAVSYVNDYLKTYGKNNTFQSITIIPAEELGAFYVTIATIDSFRRSRKTYISQDALPNT
jgi:hypothetical protein